MNALRAIVVLGISALLVAAVGPQLFVDAAFSP